MKPALVEIVGLGAGGHAKVLLELIGALGGYRVVGMTDPRTELHGSNLLGSPILGGDDRLLALRSAGVDAAFVGVGAVKGVGLRVRLFELAVGLGFQMARLTHPRAFISPSACIGEGTVVLAGAVVSSQVLLGKNVAVYPGAVIEHETRVGDHVHISPGVQIAGGVQIGAESFVGIGAVIIQSIRIGSRAVIGAGAVVVRDVPDGVTVVGVPARIAGTA